MKKEDSDALVDWNIKVHKDTKAAYKDEAKRQRLESGGENKVSAASLAREALEKDEKTFKQ